MSANTCVTALLAEDEAPQRAALLAMLETAWPGLDIVAACEDGIAALQATAEHRPRVAFLDIRMPGVGGLDVARAVVAGGGLVVFTTAYDEYAIRAFEAGAVDYLLKPIVPARLGLAVERLQARLRQPPRDDMQAVTELEARLRPQGERQIRWISASVGDHVRMIGIDEVLFFQAQDKYVRVVTADGEALIRTPVKELLAGLDPDAFWQVHRGTLVRVSSIDRVRRDEFGKTRISLRGHRESLPVSAAFVHRFRGM
ncbi:LytTR family DNA-binding domain-containing protein [Luteimonas sp. 100069]|uniref:LytR/AlgR family response regulator transcription factor n=1 Tax=Luteimonas sp. 100069 TaxID=2006109 RepID=UPI000F501CD3|nr:LytTR family DNA-binding domain-containing protein [Luteimonas sp. 100069]RPD88062.1 DNA-binding response regulator [Luteimonas sp. 100069]